MKINDRGIFFKFTELEYILNNTIQANDLEGKHTYEEIEKISKDTIKHIKDNGIFLSTAPNSCVAMMSYSELISKLYDCSKEFM